MIVKQKIDDQSHTICEGDRKQHREISASEFRGNITNYHYSNVFSLFLFSLSLIFHHFLGIQTPPNNRVQFTSAPKSIHQLIRILFHSLFQFALGISFSLIGIWKGTTRHGFPGDDADLHSDRNHREPLHQNLLQQRTFYQSVRFFSLSLSVMF